MRGEVECEMPCSKSHWNYKSSVIVMVIRTCTSSTKRITPRMEPLRPLAPLTSGSIAVCGSWKGNSRQRLVSCARPF